MNRNVIDLLRELRNLGAEVTYENHRGTVEGRPVIWRSRWVKLAHGYAWISFDYANWPPDGTYHVRAWAHDFTIWPITTVEELWTAWDRLKAVAAKPPAPVTRPERLGQLDLLDLLATAA